VAETSDSTADDAFLGCNLREFGSGKEARHDRDNGEQRNAMELN
jgi:hypothetical protein